MTSSHTSSTPLPCPFCGSDQHRRGQLDDDVYYIQCTNCWTTGPNATDEADSVRVWNKRVPQSDEEQSHG